VPYGVLPSYRRAGDVLRHHLQPALAIWPTGRRSRPGSCRPVRTASSHSSSNAGSSRSGSQVEALLGMDPMPEVPIDPAILSRDPAVGEAYAADELVYHGGFHRETLAAIFAGARATARDPGFGDLPTLWIHGEGDVLAPLDASTEAMKHLRGSNTEEHVYPGAQHEVLNEINKDEVLDDVVRFLRRVLGLRAVL
jgi:pimeloyl-ACP methyl ester carboxylesterase